MDYSGLTREPEEEKWKRLAERDYEDKFWYHVKICMDQNRGVTEKECENYVREIWKKEGRKIPPKYAVEEDEKIIRKGWTEPEKEQVRIKQDGRCAMCQKPPPRWEYDHIDGNRENNSLSNCQGLCPNCHSVKTHESF